MTTISLLQLKFDKYYS